jgi:hypothetical protein
LLNHEIKKKDFLREDRSHLGVPKWNIALVDSAVDVETTINEEKEYTYQSSKDF